MSVRSNRLSRIAVFGVIAALSLAVNLRNASAVSLTIDSALSSINVVVSVGAFLDGQGNNTNEDTGNPYAPGDLGPGADPDDPNLYPVTFSSLGDSIGQGSLGAAGFIAPGGAVAVFGDGSSAQLNGNILVTPAGFQIDGASIGLNNSGLYQPTNPLDTNAPPTASEIGVVLDLNNVIPTAYAVARLIGTSVNLSTGPVSLDGGGNFSDPNGLITIVNSNVIGFAQLPPVLGGATDLSTAIINTGTTATIAGTYSVVGPLVTLSIPNLTANTYVAGGDSLPGLYLQLAQTTNIVATAIVPEPSTLVLAGMGLLGLAFTGYRRIRK